MPSAWAGVWDTSPRAGCCEVAAGYCGGNLFKNMAVERKMGCLRLLAE